MAWWKATSGIAHDHRLSLRPRADTERRTLVRPLAPVIPAGLQKSVAASAALAAHGAGYRVRRMLGHRHARYRGGRKFRSAGTHQKSRQSEYHPQERETAGRTKSHRP